MFGMDYETRQFIRDYFRKKASAQQSQQTQQTDSGITLDPQPSMLPPLPKLKPPKKPPRRVFPFKRYPQTQSQ
jgi:hypothetical protein